MDVFDGTQFINNAENSYQYETNHAFQPLFPYIILGQKVLKNDSLAFKAAAIYIFNHSMVYQIALQSEITFAFTTFLGLLFMFWRVDPDDIVKSVHLSNIVPGTVIFGVSVLSRTMGMIMIGFTGIILLKKTVARSDNFCKIFQYIFFILSSIIIIFLPFGMTVFWKPYVMHCETKLDRTDAVPKWCLDSFPNIYNYIQKVYWDVQFMGFLHRKAEHFIVALPMNIFVFYVIYRFIQAQSWNFLTFGIFGIKENNNRDKHNIFYSPALISFAWHFIITMLIIMLCANIDINSRIASTNVLYYWCFAYLIEEFQSGKQTMGGQFVTLLMMVHNLFYMTWNFQWFPLEVSFF